jgi:hypothetical protein
MWPSSLTRSAFWAVGVAVLFLVAAGPARAGDGPDVDPTPDPFGTPVMPENPSQVDVGREVYYYHCMPCHGHEGQGLTDEFRQLWEEDHQNCWARGCHSPRDQDTSFAIPRTVPAVSGGPTTLAHFATPQELHDYLAANHPPQRPGALEDDQYWAATAFLLAENGRLAPGTIIGSAATRDSPAGPVKRPGAGLLVALLAALLVALVLIALAAVRRRRRAGSEPDSNQA